jgi:hypothetical protein
MLGRVHHSEIILLTHETAKQHHDSRNYESSNPLSNFRHDIFGLTERLIPISPQFYSITSKEEGPFPETGITT